MEQEAKDWADLVQVTDALHSPPLRQADFQDSYRNMTYKNLLGLAWLVSWCPQAR